MAIDSALTVTDPDNQNLATATVTISGGLQAGDVLHFTNQNGIIGSYNSGTGVLTLTGSSSVVNYQTALRSVTFDNLTNDNPTNFGANLTRTINWVANDGATNSNTGTSTINVTAVNDAPVVDLNGAPAGTSVSLAYTSGAAATAIAPSGTITDVDSADFNTGTLTVAFTANGSANDQLTIQNQGVAAGQIGVSGSTITYGGVTIGTFAGGTNGANLVVTFTSAAATPAAAQALLDHILYSNATSGTISKTLSYTLVDGDGTANGGTSTGTATVTINVTAGDTTPPTLNSITAPNVSQTNGATTTVTFIFSEAVTNFTLSDVIVSDASKISLSNLTTADSITWTATATRGATNGNYTLTVGVGTFTDLAGNANTLAKSSGSLNPAGVSGEAINLALIDPTSDHTDIIHLTVNGVPAGWSLNQGTLNADGTWSIDTYDPTALSVTSATGFAGAIVLSVNASWTNADGTTSSLQTNDNVEVFAKGAPIFALSGDDHLTGSSGDDLFVLSTPIGNDTINSFDVVHDKIDLIGFAGFASFADVQAHLSQDAAGNAVITLANGQSIDLLGVSAASLSDSNFVFNQDPVTRNADNIVINNGGIMPFTGVLNNTGTVTLDARGSNTELEVIQHGLTLQGGGQVVLSDDAGNGIFAADASIALTNVDNTISGAGQLGEGQMTLINQGTIIASGNNALVIDTGTNIINNSGTLEATGSGGLVINSSVANSGLLWANAANITVNGDVTGGSATLGGTATLELGGNSSVNVAFVDASAQTLQIDGVHQFAGTVTGLGLGDSLNFTAFNNTAAVSYLENPDGLGGMLSVTEGADTLQINLVGHYIAPDFVTTYDTTHGLIVQYHDGLFI